LVLIVTAAHNGFIARAQEIVRERGTPEQQRVCDMLWAGELNTVEKLQHYYAVMGSLYARNYDAATAAATRGRGTNSPEPLNRAFGPGGFMESYDLRPELSRITAPTLILAGRHDWICAPEFSEEIHRLIPGSDLRIFENSSHSIRVDEPQAMVDAIAGFVVYKKS
jgi:proline iminopeptidase